MAKYEILFKNGLRATFEHANFDLRYIRKDEPIYFEKLYINTSEVLTIHKLEETDNSIARKEGE